MLLQSKKFDKVRQLNNNYDSARGCLWLSQGCDDPRSVHWRCTGCSSKQLVRCHRRKRLLLYMDHELEEFDVHSAIVVLSTHSTTLDIWRCYRWKRAADYVLEEFALVGKFLYLHEQLEVVRANKFIRVLFYRKFFDPTDKLMNSYRATLESWELDFAAKQARWWEVPPADSDRLTAVFAAARWHGQV